MLPVDPGLQCLFHSLSLQSAVDPVILLLRIFFQIVELPAVLLLPVDHLPPPLSVVVGRLDCVLDTSFPGKYHCLKIGVKDA